MRVNQIRQRKSDRMTAKELAQLARLLILWVSYCEGETDAKTELLQLAIEVIARAQSLQDDPIIAANASGLPF